MSNEATGWRELYGTQTSGSETAYSEDGVDLTLIRWMLSLTPTERLEALQEHLWGVMRLRGDATKT